ncbi:hypothetical protein [Aeromicrobium endophyticum]|uniref:Uncharacterized protein n=1 Tax=Aeromicrobium endophyticum TaxID=2292704 RepID=A0A371PDQ6_9ACTN|nr:hypothetical protein [Aeromicrobium endophyticum]REK73648.1 hypothetical protein DX116_08970 [Aeromicrobium endophyticum]
MPIAIEQDVVKRFRALTSEEAAVVPTWLKDAEADLASKVVALRERFEAADDESDFRQLATATVCAAVIRVLRNPDGWRQFALDDGSFTRDQVISSGLLQFQDDEVTRLQPIVVLGGAYVIGLGG